MNIDYEANGYLVIRGFYEEYELRELRNILRVFHESWKSKNHEFYSTKAINSAYLTSSEYLNQSQRMALFKFIGSDKLMKIARSLMSEHICFMNTQLFFNPVNKDQKNYWHRDPQYHLSVEEQKQALLDQDVIHFRIPLEKEPGLELIPGTHKRWDSQEELDVRLERNGRKNCDDISNAAKVELGIGDLLIFSGNMIHRGLYGMNRFSFDILFFNRDPALIQFVAEDCLPSLNTIEDIDNPIAFVNALHLKRLAGRAQ